MFRFPPRLPKTLLSLLFASSLAGCMAGGDGPENENTTQQIRGSIPLSQFSADVVGVRVLAANEQVSTAKTDANGNFSIEVPVGVDYAFEIVTTSGTYPVLSGPLNGTTPMHFDVCTPGEGYDLGDINPLDFEEIDGDDTPWSDTEDECDVPPWICEDGTEDCFDHPLECDDPASDPTFCWDAPLPCDNPGSDPEFCWGDGDGGCDDPYDPDGGCDEPPPPDCVSADPYGECDEPPPPYCDPYDPDGGECNEPPPPYCDPYDPDGGCDEPPPPYCDPYDPDGGCDEPPPPPPCDGPYGDPGNCDEPPPYCDPYDPEGGCDEPPPPHCVEPSDPSCGDEPPDVGCEDGYDEPSCWPEPDVCLLTPDSDFSDCDVDIGGAPQNPIPDFGCEEVQN